jgi:murein DD-endopeptidase MepM/ murein hydrolase activator NlpD
LTVPPRAAARFGRRTRASSRAIALPRAGWAVGGVLAVLSSGVAWASLPKAADIRADERVQWQALAIAPLSNGGRTGMRMDATAAVAPIDAVPERKIQPVAVAMAPEAPKPALLGPLRIRGRVGDGLYWSLRAAGASPQVAAQYLSALSTEIDVGGDVGPGDNFDMVLGNAGDLLYAGLDRVASRDLQLVKWSAGGRAEWLDAAHAEQPTEVAAPTGLPVAGHITSYFGYRYHPILHFTRFHAGVDIGAAWGSPIVAVGDGQVVGAGWAGGYGRQVRIAHSGGLMSSYSHMSSIAAAPGSFVHAGQVIGYVGSSGLSTGPHLHYEVLANGRPVNPLAVRFASVQMVDNHVADAVKARLKQLLSVGLKHA